MKKDTDNGTVSLGSIASVSYTHLARSTPVEDHNKSRLFSTAGSFL